MISLTCSETALNLFTAAIEILPRSSCSGITVGKLILAYDNSESIDVSIRFLSASIFYHLIASSNKA